MKKGMIIFWILLYPLFVTAQDYLNSTCTWKETYNELIFGISTYEAYDIKLVGDTIINNTPYHKVLKTGIRQVTNTFFDSLIERTSTSELLSPIREENGVFYHFNTFSGSEQILHNFNLEIGDTILSNCSTPQIVESIDTVWVGSIPRKRFKAQGNSRFFLIEGIGSTRGLYQSTCNTNIHVGRRLRCYSFEDQFIEFDTLAECGTTVKVENTNLINIELDIFPNPFTESLFIDWYNFSPDTEIYIVNTLGHIIHTEALRSSRQQLNTKYWIADIYFYQLRQKGQIIKQGKLIKH